MEVTIPEFMDALIAEDAWLKGPFGLWKKRRLHHNEFSYCLETNTFSCELDNIVLLFQNRPDTTIIVKNNCTVYAGDNSIITAGRKLKFRLGNYCNVRFGYGGSGILGLLCTINGITYEGKSVPANYYNRGKMFLQTTITNGDIVLRRIINE